LCWTSANEGHFLKDFSKALNEFGMTAQYGLAEEKPLPLAGK
jgi:hypothetical protein